MLLLCHSTSSLSWRTGEPECWSKVNVIPVFNKGREEDPENCRPVSLTSVPGKVITTRPGCHFQACGGRTIPYTFTKRKSCLCNLMAFCDGLSGQVDEERAVGVVCLDSSRVFGALSCNILLALEVWIG